MNELDVLKDVSVKLGNASIDFMLSGSLALGHYTQPRMTRDIDIVIHLTKSSVAVLFDLLKDDYSPKSNRQGGFYCQKKLRIQNRGV